MSLALVRAEIKSWERDFATTHGRDPSVQDIRDQPHITEKYKLYKKLSKAHARLPTPKSRPEDTIPPPGFNPFSPVKKFPFATPAKKKPSHPRTETPSPDSFFLPDASAPSTAISRARKRLRGEPVSPSPSKPKRQRIRSQVPSSFPKLDRDSSNSEHDTDQELPQCDFTSSFVADSPVKAPVGGKSFQLLFDDALPALSVAKKPGPLITEPGSGLGEPSLSTSRRPHHAIKLEGIASGPEHRVNRTQAKPAPPIFPAKDNLAVSQSRASNKRALDGTALVPSQSQPLVPPSPPPQDLIIRDTGKRKAKATTVRKKPRVEDQESDEGVDSPDDITLKVATVRSHRSSIRHVDDLEWDPLLHLGTRNHELSAEEQIDANHRVSGTFSVDLPDKFRRVLAISPPRNRSSREERVVRGLLSGDRVGHYNPSRGGDIWGAGETDEGTLGDAETEDDWEGEPVPWEVGEL